jgi:hypothetical protein
MGMTSVFSAVKQGYREFRCYAERHQNPYQHEVLPPKAALVDGELATRATNEFIQRVVVPAANAAGFLYHSS